MFGHLHAEVCPHPRNVVYDLRRGSTIEPGHTILGKRDDLRV
jgi:hypothetical protein